MCHVLGELRRAHEGDDRGCLVATEVIPITGGVRAPDAPEVSLFVTTVLATDAGSRDEPCIVASLHVLAVEWPASFLEVGIDIAAGPVFESLTREDELRAVEHLVEVEEDEVAIFSRLKRESAMGDGDVVTPDRWSVAHDELTFSVPQKRASCSLLNRETVGTYLTMILPMCIETAIVNKAQQSLVRRTYRSCKYVV